MLSHRVLENHLVYQLMSFHWNGTGRSLVLFVSWLKAVSFRWVCALPPIPHDFSKQRLSTTSNTFPIGKFTRHHREKNSLNTARERCALLLFHFLGKFTMFSIFQVQFSIQFSTLLFSFLFVLFVVGLHQEKKKKTRLKRGEIEEFSFVFFSFSFAFSVSCLFCTTPVV